MRMQCLEMYVVCEFVRSTWIILDGAVNMAYCRSDTIEAVGVRNSPIWHSGIWHFQSVITGRHHTEIDFLWASLSWVQPFIFYALSLLYSLHTKGMSVPYIFVYQHKMPIIRITLVKHIYINKSVTDWQCSFESFEKSNKSSSYKSVSSHHSASHCGKIEILLNMHYANNQPTT